jgi:16S rRNA (guanine966-N2)-methyltransferase
MTLRIIGGQFKNRLLKAPKGSKTRPTLAILRKAVFDMLQFTIPDARFLDLFAGSGVMGIEALSRGAGHAAFPLM